MLRFSSTILAPGCRAGTEDAATGATTAGPSMGHPGGRRPSTSPRVCSGTLEAMVFRSLRTRRSAMGSGEKGACTPGTTLSTSRTKLNRSASLCTSMRW